MQALGHALQPQSTSLQDMAITRLAPVIEGKVGGAVIRGIAGDFMEPACSKQSGQQGR